MPDNDIFPPWRYDPQTRSLSVSLSSARNLYAFTSAGKAAELWNWSSNSVAQHLNHDASVATVALSRNGLWCVTVELGGRKIRVWDLKEVNKVSSAAEDITYDGIVLQAAISDDGKHVALSIDKPPSVFSATASLNFLSCPTTLSL
jgi:WD40 repeat protein